MAVTDCRIYGISSGMPSAVVVDLFGWYVYCGGVYAVRKKSWTLPPAGMFSQAGGVNYRYTEYTGANIADFLTRGGLPCRCTDNIPGAAVDLYTFRVLDFYKLSHLPRLLPALTAFLGCSVTQATNAPAGAFCLQVARRHRQTVYFSDCVKQPGWTRSSRPAALLGTAGGNTVTALNIDRAPHVLIAGQTGSGKSVLMNTIICSLLLKNTPSQARFIFIDPKRVEFSCYSDLPHVKDIDFITSADRALERLQSICNLMDRRYEKMTAAGDKEFSGKKIYIFIDELADLMLTAGKQKKAVENAIVRIAQKGRAAGLHLIIATQTPRAAVITGLISANIPVKIALTVSNTRESVLILGHKGAETLAGKGDAILKSPAAGEIRFQTALVTDSEIDNLLHFWRQQKPPPTLKTIIRKLFF